MFININDVHKRIILTSTHCDLQEPILLLLYLVICKNSVM